MVRNKVTAAIITCSIVFQITGFGWAAPMEYYGKYKVGPGDKLSVIEGDREYQLLVTQNGRVSLPGFGSIEVIDKTIEEIQEHIDAVKDSPDYKGKGTPLTVNLALKNPEDVAVIGCFNRPGAQAVSRLSVIVANAGDLSPSANGKVYVYFPDSSKPKKYNIDRFRKGVANPEADPWIPRWSVVVAGKSPIKSFFAGKTINLVYTLLASAAVVVAINNSNK